MLKSAIFLCKVLYFDQMCYKSAIINPKSAIKALYFMGTSAINYSTFAIFFFGRVRALFNNGLTLNWTFTYN